MQPKQSYEFGPFQLSTAEHLLRRDGDVVPLTPRVIDVLALLVERNGHLLEREELLSSVWSDSFVEEANLTVSISALRKALGQQSDGHQYIETVPKRGYRFVADVTVVAAEEEELLLRERTRAKVIVEREEEREEDNDHAENSTEIEADATAQAKAAVNSRRRRQALIVGVAAIVVMTAAASWWKTTKTRQAEANAQIRSIAVLPFTQLGEAEKDELVGFGMADVLITRIGGMNRISVRPTNAVFKYIGAAPDIESVGRELKVDAVVEGSIQRIGERTRVTVRLVRARDGELLWAKTFDGSIKDLFELQDQMSKGVAVALALNPADEQKSLLTKRYTKSTEAYHAYRMGRYFWNKRRPDDLKKAVEYFEQAIQRDTDYALAFAGLADSYALLGDYGVASAQEVFPKMKRAAARAVEIDDRLAEAHTSLAYAKRLSDWDWPGAEQEFKLAIELNNSYATAHHWYSEYLAGMGRFDEALEEARRAEELDPRSLIINTNLGWILYLGRRYDEAVEELKTTLEMDPNFFLAQQLLWQTYVQKGMYDEALSGKEIKGSEETREKDELLKKAYDVAGWKGFERKVLELALERKKPGDKPGGPWAVIYAAVGDYDMALQCLEKGYENREAWMVWVKVSPDFDDLRSHPRFQDLLSRMRLSD
jgi:DNA-binding winged helix-turn-helix (wHTH) protein/TolB-like protein/Tfp pilus assembly protein PilF